MSNHAPARFEITGAVLAGGLGRRMADPGADVDKGLQNFRGRPMIEWALERLAPQVGALLINANRNIERYCGYGYPVVSDRIAGYAGPLAGLHAAMQAATTRWVLTVPCDSPFFPDDLATRLSGVADRDGAEIAVAASGGRLQPVFAIVERSLVEALTTYLNEGGRKIDRWFGSRRCVEVAFDDPAAFRNINTREELARYTDE